MLPVLYFLIKKLLGKNIARSSVVLMGLSPVLLGISLMINTDAILWSMLPAALLSFLVYQKDNNRKFLYLSGFFLGLALIDKYIANILFPFFFGLIILKYIFENSAIDTKDYFKKAFADLGSLVLTSAATVFIFFPAAWIKPKILLEVTIFSKAFYSTWPVFLALVFLALFDVYVLKSKVLMMLGDWARSRRTWLSKAPFGLALGLVAFVLLNTYAGMKIFDFQPVFDFPSMEYSSIKMHFSEPFAIFLASFYPLIFGLTPVVAAFFLFSMIQALRGKLKSGALFWILSLLLFILFYYAGSAASGVAPTPRYQIVIYPLASIIAAVGLDHLISTKTLKKNVFSAYLYPAVLLALVVVSLCSLWLIRPFYLSYASDLLPKKYVLGFRDMGDGSWEAAQYLNALPDARNLKVWSDKGGVCERFVGTCRDSFKQKALNMHFDYFIVSAGRKSKSVSRGGGKLAQLNGTIPIVKLYSEENPAVFRLNIDDRSANYVKIIKAEDMQ
jgi:4-amino-4-deoxy-L-arabinose transferase-like glycosyltransferase